ncbi:hypothetical protein GWK47_034905 [Chionoecetes opilio]|uniref:Uncharacterized protein n=1 Tax=Chionoecetes opilio TaxID=41210 RepID=A0A8J4YUJ5_CHIOP|nr:hypothetical protein GWK47_034905 [Chionoecetes opilio]
MIHKKLIVALIHKKLIVALIHKKLIVAIISGNDGSSYCMHKKGSFKLKYKDVETRCFHLSGLELKHDDLIIMNDFKAKVKFHGLPRWAKALHVWVVDVQGKACGEVKHVKETPIIVPGNYTVNQEYYLKYQPEMHEEMEGECSTRNGRQSAGPYKYFNRKEEKG